MQEKHVLIADDDLGILDLLEDTLEYEGYRVHKAQDGRRAVEIARKKAIDVAVLDWKMPKMDGFEALKAIKTIDPNIQVLIITAFADAESLNNIMKEGASDYIIKPFHKSDIVHAVRNAQIRRRFAVENVRLKRELEERLAQLEADFEERTRQLRESQVQYKEIVENSNDGIMIAQDGVLKFVNPVALELTGYSHEEITSIPFAELIHPEDRGMVQDRHRRRLEGEEFPSTYAFRAVRKDGKIFWVEINAIRTLWQGRPATLNIIRDITERKRAEEQLRESQERYDALFDRTILCVYVHDFEGRLLDANDAALELIGYSRDELPSLHLSALMEKQDLERSASAVQHLLRGESALAPMEYRLRRKNGESVWIEAEASVLYRGGKPYAVQGIARDVTQKKQAEEELRRSEEKYRLVVENAHEGIVVIQDGRIRFVNPTIMEFSGFFGKELLDKPFPGLIHEDDREMVVDRYRRRLRGEDVPNRYEFRVVWRDGEVRHVEITSLLIEWEGRPATLSFLNDITERKRAERALESEKERLAVTLRSIGDGVITTDTAGAVAVLNKKAEELTGWTQQEAAGRHCDEVFHIVDPRTRKRCESPVSRILDAGEPEGQPVRAMLIARNGAERAVSASAAPIRDAESRTVGAVLVFQDITQILRIEEELLRTEKLESIGVLAGGIAHDFNNILVGVIGNISLAKTRIENGGAALENLEKAEKASWKAQALTQQLLTFSQGGSPVKKPSDISELIRESAEFALTGSNVRCEFFIAEDLWAAEVDAGQISHAINNLIINAYQAMPGGGVIQVRAENRQVTPRDGLSVEPGRYIHVWIRDEGVGIEKELLSKIFDPYFTTKQKGSGLGLATVHSIVRRHGGHIAVESEVGRGSTFHVYLPASRAVPVGSERRAGTVQGGRGRLLVMDDEEMIRDLLTELLDTLGYEAETVSDGAGALDAYQRARDAGEPFDAVILDLTIAGGMGGREAMARLREIDPDVKGIVSSGYSTDPVMGDHERYGFQGVLIKPYRLQEIAHVLNTVLAG